MAEADEPKTTFNEGFVIGDDSDDEVRRKKSLVSAASKRNSGCRNVNRGARDDFERHTPPPLPEASVSKRASDGHSLATVSKRASDGHSLATMSKRASDGHTLTSVSKRASDGHRLKETSEMYRSKESEIHENHHRSKESELHRSKESELHRLKESEVHWSKESDIHRSKESCMQHGQKEETHFHHLLRCLEAEHNHQIESMRKALNAALSENLIETQERRRASQKSARRRGSAQKRESFGSAGSLESARSMKSSKSIKSIKSVVSTKSVVGAVAELLHKGGDAIRRTLSDRREVRNRQIDDFATVHPESGQSCPSSRQPSQIASSAPSSPSSASARVRNKYAGEDNGTAGSSPSNKPGSAYRSGKASSPAKKAVANHMSEEARAFRLSLKNPLGEKDSSDSSGLSSEGADGEEEDKRKDTMENEKIKTREKQKTTKNDSARSNMDAQKVETAATKDNEIRYESAGENPCETVAAQTNSQHSQNRQGHNGSAVQVSSSIPAEAPVNNTTLQMPELSEAQEANDKGPKVHSTKSWEDHKETSKCAPGRPSAALAAAAAAVSLSAELAATEEGYGSRRPSKECLSSSEDSSSASMDESNSGGDDNKAAERPSERSAMKTSDHESPSAASGSTSKIAESSAAEKNIAGEATRGSTGSLISDASDGASVIRVGSGPDEDQSHGCLTIKVQVPDLEAAQPVAHIPSADFSAKGSLGVYSSSNRDSNASMLSAGEMDSTQSWVPPLGMKKALAAEEGVPLRRSLNGTNANGRKLSFSGPRASLQGMSMPSIDEQTAGGTGKRRMSLTAQMQQETRSSITGPEQHAVSTPTTMQLSPPTRRVTGGSILKKKGVAGDMPRNSARHRISFDEAVTSFERTCVELTPGRNSSRPDGGAVEAISFDSSAVVTLRDKEEDSECEDYRTVYVTRELWNVQEDDEKEGRLSVDSKESRLRKRRTSRLRKLFTEDSPSHDVNSFLRNNTFTEEEEQKAILQEQSFCRRMMTPPNSTFNFYWDLLSMFFIATDIVVIPLAVFDPEDNTLTDVISNLTTLFWTGDLFRNFFVGHFKKGKVVIHAKAIVWNYLKTWFILDFVIVILDWTMLLIKLFTEDVGGGSGATKILRSLRNVRTLRLLRSMKASHLLKLIEDRINSEVVSVIWTLGKLFGIIIVCNHLIACGWYWIGKSCIGNMDNWVIGAFLSPGSEQLEPGDFRLHERPLEYRYFTSFHWATTHFVSSQISIEPNNIYERVFAIVVVFFALIAVSSFVGGLTSAVMHLGSMSSAKSKQFWLLKRYLRESGVSAQLSVRIHNYCDYMWQSQEARVQEGSVQVLSLLSTSLRSELATAIYEPRLSSHPFFVLIGKVAPMTIRFLCSAALSRTSLGRGDCLFSTQEMASQMWFVCVGQLMYYMDEEDPEEVEDNMWLCEPVLWVTDWTHRGTVQVSTEAELVAVDSEKFGSCLHSNLDARYEAVTYCRGYIQNLNRVMHSRLSDLYRTPLIEGLWFRLMNEHKSKPVTKTNSLMARRAATVGHRPLPSIAPSLSRAWSKTMGGTLSTGADSNGADSRTLSDRGR